MGQTDQTTRDASRELAPSESSADDEALDGEGAVTPSAILEAILFVGHPNNEPLTSRRMAGYLRGVSPQEVDELIVQLNQQYEAQSAPYEIVSDESGYRMALRPEFH